MMLKPGETGYTLDSALPPVDGFAVGSAVTGASRLRDINREVVLYADQ